MEKKEKENKEGVKIAKGIKIRKSNFVKVDFMFDFDIPEDCDLIVLMGNKGSGYVPYRCLLSHQVYLQDIKEAFEKEHFEVIFVLPVNSLHPFAIAYNGEYGKQRWGKK